MRVALLYTAAKQHQQKTSDEYQAADSKQWRVAAPDAIKRQYGIACHCLGGSKNGGGGI